MLKRLAIFCGLPFLFMNLNAQEEYLRFKRLTINDGLSLSSVYDIYQDSKGFMWFGTEDGLNKYDGQRITVYGAQTDKHNLLANKWIELIYEDKTGMIWLGTRSGLTKYNPRKGVFTPILHEEDDSTTLSNDTISCIQADFNNEIWIGTYQGLNHVDRFTNEVTRIQPDEEELQGLQSRITGFLQDEDGRMWIGTYDGLYSYDWKSGLFFRELLGGLLDEDTRVYHMESRDGIIWLGTAKGLVQMNSSPDAGHRLIPLEEAERDENIIRVLPDPLGQVWVLTQRRLLCFREGEQDFRMIMEAGGTTHSLALDPTEDLLVDQEGYIWFGTFGNGLFRIDPEDLSYQRYQHNPADPESLSENSINCITLDRSGAIWIGTFGAGISILNPASNRFTLFKHNPYNPNSMASSFVWTICETLDSVLWMGTNAFGISCFDMRTAEFTHYDHRPNDPGSLSHSSVRKIFQDSRGRIWIGTDGGGLNLYNPSDRSFFHFRHDRADSSSISHNSVRTVFEDRDGRIWVGTRHGLNLFLGEGKGFRHYLITGTEGDAPAYSFVYSAIHQDKDGKLWVGTYGGGLCLLDPDKGQFERLYNDPDNPNSLSDNIVFSIYEDPMGRYWIGTNSGLNMFYPATGSFRRFGISEGLANEVIYGILPDDNNCIWLSTNLGISCFNLESFEVKNFDMNDGLQSNEFNGGAYHKGYSGKLYFGGVYGMNIIDPDQIPTLENPTEVTLTKFEVMGKEVEIAGVDLEEEFDARPGRILEHDNHFYSSENITYMEEIELDYRHRFFSIEFSALNNQQAEKLDYSYIMENLETDWNNAGSRNYVSYANMKAGTYTLKVVALNEDGIRSDTPLQLNITITPPIWLSWWFILLEVFLATGVVVMIYTYLLKSRTNRILKDQNEKISQANEALRKSEKNLMELNATKDKFFSIISHDLKNPFSSLLSISELMVDNFEDTDKDDHRAGFKKIHQSVKHLLDLLENLLTWSRSQRGRIKYEPVRFNLTALIRENINIHRMLAEKKGILLLSPMKDELYAYGDRNMINSVIRNLMTNAVKFTPRNKKVEIKVEAVEDSLEVSIIDEGIGIPEEYLPKLFRIDEKYKSNGTDGEKGTGLGLIICREFVEKNGGEISVHSKAGKGSTFSFTIPTAN